jgi:hypothetical protein
MSHVFFFHQSRACGVFHTIPRTYYSCYYLYFINKIKVLSVALRYTVRVKCAEIYYFPSYFQAKQSQKTSIGGFLQIAIVSNFGLDTLDWILSEPL